MDGRAAQAAIALDLGIAPHHGRHAGDVRQPAQRLGVLEGKRANRGRDSGRRRARGLDLARHDADQVGAELREFGQYKTMNALADRRQQYHGGDADGDAQQRQKTAQPVRGDGAQGEMKGVDRTDHD